MILFDATATTEICTYCHTPSLHDALPIPRQAATKRARHFSGDEPPATLVDRLEKDFERTGGDLPSLYRTLVGSPEPWAAAPTMFKSPWDWTVSMLRALKTTGLGERQNIAAKIGRAACRERVCQYV